MQTRILLIDDDKILAAAIQRALQEMNYSVTLASNGIQGVEWMESESFDLVISDVLMPDMDGIEVALYMHKAKKNIKLIMMSGGGKIESDFYLHVASKLGANYVIPKPFSMEQLKMLITNLLEKDKPSQ